MHRLESSILLHSTTLCKGDPKLRNVFNTAAAQHLQRSSFQLVTHKPFSRFSMEVCDRFATLFAAVRPSCFKHRQGLHP